MPVKANLAKFSLHPSKSSNVIVTFVKGNIHFKPFWGVLFLDYPNRVELLSHVGGVLLGEAAEGIT